MHRQGRRERPVGVVARRDGRAEHRHHCVADVLHDRSSLGKNGTIHLGPVTVELLGQHRWVGVLGDRGVATDVAHHDGHVERLGFADRAALGDELIGDAGGQQPAQALALLLAFDDRPVQASQPVEGPGLAARHAFGEVDEQPLHSIVDCGWRGVERARRSP